VAVSGEAGVGVGAAGDAAEACAEEALVEAHDYPLGDVAAAVAASVNDEAFFADLGVIPFDEFVGAGAAHVGDVEVADFAAGGFGDAVVVGEDGVEVA